MIFCNLIDWPSEGQILKNRPDVVFFEHQRIYRGINVWVDLEVNDLDHLDRGKLSRSFEGQYKFFINCMQNLLDTIGNVFIHTIWWKLSYWPLLDTTEQYWTLLDFTAYYWLILDTIGHYWTQPNSTGHYWTSLATTGLYWTLLTITGYFWLLLITTGFYSILPGYILVATARYWTTTNFATKY